MEYLCLEEEGTAGNSRRLFFRRLPAVPILPKRISGSARTDNGKAAVRNMARLFMSVKDAEGKPQKAFGVSHVHNGGKSLEEKKIFQRAMQKHYFPSIRNLSVPLKSI
jgi:tRNA U38,U39,U40 pseudouridine synthase TruA